MNEMRLWAATLWSEGGGATLHDHAIAVWGRQANHQQMNHRSHITYCSSLFWPPGRIKPYHNIIQKY